MMVGRFVAGGLAALLFVAAGLFWWQGRAAGEGNAQAPPPLPIAVAAADMSLPEGDPDAIGDAPPMPASASPQSREQRRFGRYDRNRDGIISRDEMLSSRTKAFKALDKDGNNLLSFEEWAVATVKRFEGADGDRNGRLTPVEFATTAPKEKPKPKCRC